MKAVFVGGSSGIGLAATRRAAAGWSLLTNGFVTGTVLHVDGGHRLAAP